MTTTLTRWLGHVDPNDPSGTATFYAGGRSVDVPLPSFQHARELASLIEWGQRTAATQARRAAVNYLRGIASQLENDIG